MDWQAVGALGVPLTAIGTVLGWLGHIVYHRGWIDKGAISADLQAAASIVRLESAVQKLTDTVNQHLVDDARNFGELRAMLTSTNGIMNNAASAVMELTRRLDQAIDGRK